MFDRSIAYRLSIYISLAVISVFIVFIFITFIFSRNTVQESIENSAIGESTEIIGNVERQLVATREISANISEQVLYYAINDDVDLFVHDLMKKYNFLNAIHVNIDSVLPDINYSNYYIFRKMDSLVFEKRNKPIFLCQYENEFYEKVTKNGIPGWSEVFPCDKNGNMIVSFYTPVVIDGKENKEKVIGSVICELSLMTLNDSINRIKIDNRGFAVLVSRDGTYLSHPEREKVFKENIKSIPNQSYDNKNINISEVLEGKLSGASYYYSEHLENEKCWIYGTPIAETGWTLFVIIPMSNLYKPLYILILKLLFFSILGILIIYYIITIISNRLIQPLSTVTAQLKKFSNFSGESELKTMDEIKMVSESLDYIKDWYQNLQINQFQEAKKNSRRMHDLLEASEIQMSLINTDFSQFEKRNDIDLYAVYKPARIVSGDLYDFFFLDDDNIFFSIGDVSGKGVSAAFFMSIAQTIIKSNAKIKKPKEIVRKVNNELFTSNQHQFFLTLFVGILNLKTGKLNYCNAAHTSTFIIKSNNELVELEQSHGMPLGIYPNKKYSDSSIILEKGDVVLVYTDGVIEIQNDKKEHLGIAAFREKLKNKFSKGPKEVITTIEIELEEFKGEIGLSDDVTILALQLNATKKA